MMEGFICVVELVLMAAYAALAIWLICTRRSVAGSLLSGLGTLCGFLAVYHYLYAVAYILAWGIVILLALALLGVLFG